MRRTEKWKICVAGGDVIGVLVFADGHSPPQAAAPGLARRFAEAVQAAHWN